MISYRLVYGGQYVPLYVQTDDSDTYRFGELLCVLPSVTPCSFFFLSTRMENRNVLSVYPLRAHTVKKKQSRSGAKINQIGISFWFFLVCVYGWLMTVFSSQMDRLFCWFPLD